MNDQHERTSSPDRDRDERDADSLNCRTLALGVSFPRLNEIVRGKRGVTPDTALRLVPAKQLLSA